MCRNRCRACAPCARWAWKERSSKQFSTLAGHAANASLTAQRWEAAYEPAVGLTLTAATALTLGLGGYLVWQGQLRPSARRPRTACTWDS